MRDFASCEAVNSNSMAKSSHGNNNNNNNIKKSITKTKRAARKATPQAELSSQQRRSSIYRGVTRHRWTGRYEAHLWDKNCWNESHNKKGRQVYLGAYDDEEAAAHAYDLAALKHWGHTTILNFPISTYEKEILEMEGQSKEEYIGSLRRKSSGFSRGVSKYRGVARHHHNGRWEARIGRVFGNKYLYLGTYATQEEAATAYDMAAIEYRGLNAVTNFDHSRYIKWIRPNVNGADEVGIQNPTQQLGLGLGLGLGLLNHCQESSAATSGTTSRSALGLLLQSSKFKEMLKQITECSNASSSLSSSPLLDPSPPRSYFPDDIQTSFDMQDSSSFAKEHGIVFGDFDSFELPMFHCDELQN